MMYYELNWQSCHMPVSCVFLAEVILRCDFRVVFRLLFLGESSANAQSIDKKAAQT